MHIVKKEILKKDFISEIDKGIIFGYSEGFFIVNEGLNFYLVNATTKEKFGPYLYTLGFYNGYAAVKRVGFQDVYFWSIIDKKGNTVAEFSNGDYKNVYFSDGYAKIGDKKFIDIKGKEIEYKPDDGTILNVSDFKNGRAIVTYKTFGKEKYYYIDKEFKRINKKTYDIAEEFNNDRAVVGKNKKRFIIDTDGNTIFKYDLTNDKMKTVSRYSNGMLSYSKNGIWGHLDQYGNIAITPRFKHSEKFSDGVVTYFENGAIYMMDKESNKKLLLTKEQSHIYDYISVFNNGYAQLYYDRLDPLADIVDKEGNITKLRDNIELYDDYVVLSDSKSFIKLDDLKKLKKEYQIVITRNNKEIIKSFESEEKRDKYFDMLIQEKNNAVDLSRQVYNEYLDKLLEASNEKNEENPNKETHKVKVKRIKR